MNDISKSAKLCKSSKIGKNNFIGNNVKIMDNVVIGNNNRIYDNTIIYPNTVIGNNNIFLRQNIIGEVGVQSSFNYENFEFKYNGLEIGNGNFFHFNNIIFNGYFKKTKIGNNNKFLSQVTIHHDTIIKNNVILYPRSMTAGLTKLLDNSTMGMNSCIQQNSVLGQYAMIGMGCIASHNIFPFYIYYNNEYIRYNTYKIPSDFKINNYNLKNMIKDIKKNKFDSFILERVEKLPKKIRLPIKNFYKNISNHKI